MKSGVVFLPSSGGGGSGWTAVDADESTPGIVTLSEPGSPVVMPAASVPAAIDAKIVERGLLAFDNSHTDRVPFQRLSNGVVEVGIDGNGQPYLTANLDP